MNLSLTAGLCHTKIAEYSATYHFSTCELLSWLLTGWLEPDGELGRREAACLEHGTAMPIFLPEVRPFALV